MIPLSVAEIAAITGGSVVGDGTTIVSGPVEYDSRAPMPPPTARSRAARLWTSARAASISLRGTVPSSDSSRCNRWLASSRLLRISASWARWLAASIGFALNATCASTSPVAGLSTSKVSPADVRIGIHYRIPAQDAR